MVISEEEEEEEKQKTQNWESGNIYEIWL
jgi:hypothetical protein